MEFKSGKSVVKYMDYEIHIKAMEERNFYTVEVKEVEYFDVIEGYETALEAAKTEINKFGE